MVGGTRIAPGEEGLLPWARRLATTLMPVPAIPARLMVELVTTDLATQCVPVDTERASGAGLVAVLRLQDSQDEALLKLTHRFIK